MASSDPGQAVPEQTVRAPRGLPRRPNAVNSPFPPPWQRFHTPVAEFHTALTVAFMMVGSRGTCEQLSDPSRGRNLPASESHLHLSRKLGPEPSAIRVRAPSSGGPLPHTRIRLNCREKGPWTPHNTTLCPAALP
jgi:hypothetical protein